ncbi:prolyl endopeptidase [Copidosoma floridanum]|uniref:prolyl endopeptidase n=1 Tax=Copidosoma floridanum TaxID=29053 RepID=UPI0006C992BE|nr:prolyl endopeptidase [Copidosoma floridanum]XP_014214334.1 prolyl endopeptidase [Copidosoma floridanum]
MTAQKFVYPEARRDETAIEVYHGVKVADPYVWLEDPDAEETKAFVDAQNALAIPFLNSCPKRQTIHDRLKLLWDFPKYSCPTKKGDKYYFFMNTGLQNQSVLYVQDTFEAEPKVFLDPNTLSEDGTVAVTSGEFSEDGSIYAYALSASGSDWNTIHFINTKTGEKYPEVLEKVKFSSISWTHDNLGIFYSCFPHQQEKHDGSETFVSKDQKLCYHIVGTSPEEDKIVAEFPENPLYRLNGQVTDCGRWLVVTTRLECRDNLVFFTKLDPKKKIDGKLNLTEVVGILEADYEYVANLGTKAIFRTNKNAPNYKLIAIDLENFKENSWEEFIPEHTHNVLNWASAADKDKLVISYMEEVKDVLGVYSLETGKLLRPLPLDVGTVVGFSGDKKNSEIFYQFMSFLTPGIIYSLDLQQDKEMPKVFKEIKISGFDPSQYQTKQIFYSSKDGTKIPMFIVSKKNIVLNSSPPALLYGYGGFNVSLQPVFSIMRTVFLQHLDGVIAVANIRGGGEYGEKWHNAGRFGNKQNCFDDFISAAEYLIDNRYTSSDKLTIQGASNGGLLICACINQRPDLFGAAIAQVPVTDMLKYHKFTVGYAWKSDYGCSDKEKDFKVLIKYSPIHNVRKPDKEGVQYPATLVMTADHDDRVVPLHSLKMIATLQHEIGSLPHQTKPLLARIEVKAGHGAGKPTTKLIEQATDILSFAVQTLNLEFH